MRWLLTAAERETFSITSRLSKDPQGPSVGTDGRSHGTQRVVSDVLMSECRKSHGFSVSQPQGPWATAAGALL